MGGYTKQGAEYTPLPRDFQKQRNDIWGYLGKGIGQEMPAYAGADQLKMPGQMMDTGRLVSWLLTGSPTGGFDPSTGSMPMGRGGSFPGDTGMGGMPMPTGWKGLGESVSTDPAYQADLARTKQNVGYGVDQAMQQAFGGGGGIQGTGMMRVAGDVANRGYVDLAANEMERQRQAQEAAMGRRQWMAGEELNQALSRAGLGMGYSQAYQEGQKLPYEYWRNQQYQNSPLFAALMGWGSQYPQQPQVPSMTPPWWVSLLGGAASGAGTYAGAKRAAG